MGWTARTICVFVAVLFVGSVFGLSVRASGDRRQGKQEITAEGADDSATVLKLEDEWTKATVKNDLAVFRSQLADGFVYTENDQMSTRDEMLKGLEASTDKIDSAKNEDIKAHVFGQTIVVTGWMMLKGSSKDGAFDRHYRFTDVWVRQKGHWMLAAAQDYLKPE